MGLISGVAVAQTPTSPSFHKTPIVFITNGKNLTNVRPVIVRVNGDEYYTLVSNPGKPQIGILPANSVADYNDGQRMEITGVQLSNSDMLTCQANVRVTPNLVNVIITQDSQGHTYCQKLFTTN